MCDNRTTHASTDDDNVGGLGQGSIRLEERVRLHCSLPEREVGQWDREGHGELQIGVSVRGECTRCRGETQQQATVKDAGRTRYMSEMDGGQAYGPR